MVSHGGTSASRNYFVTLMLSDGSQVGTRFKSNLVWYGASGLAIYGDNVVFVVYWTQYYISIFNTITSSFKIKKFSQSLYDIILDTSTGR